MSTDSKYAVEIRQCENRKKGPAVIGPAYHGAFGSAAQAPYVHHIGHHMQGNDMCGEQNKNEQNYTSVTKLLLSNSFHVLQLACHSHKDKQTKKVWLPPKGSRTPNCALLFTEPKRHTINAYDSIYNAIKRGSKGNILDKVISSDTTPPALSKRVHTAKTRGQASEEVVQAS